MKEEFMRQAIEISRRGVRDNKGGPFGAVVVHNGKIVGKGCNQVTSTNDPTAHAEIQAIRDACRNLHTFNLEGCELFTSCEPCPMCLSAIYWSRLDKVYYANTRKDAAQIQFDDDFIYRQIPLAPDRCDLKLEPLLRDEALKVFKEWEEKPDKIPY